LPHKELRGIIFTMRARRIINKQLGELLLGRGIINQGQLDQALKIQRDRGGLIGAILIESGFAGEEDIAQSLTAQYGFPYLPLSNYDVSPEITGIIPGRVARQYLLVPIDKTGNNLTLAMSNPLDIRAIEDVELLSGCSVQAFVSTSSDIKRAIEKYYKNKE
jgi:type IV pilus assembly protein PilB